MIVYRPGSGNAGVHPKWGGRRRLKLPESAQIQDYLLSRSFYKHLYILTLRP